MSYVNYIDSVPVSYYSSFVNDPDQCLEILKNELEWTRVGNTPRSEYYCNDFDVPYTYGSGNGVRTYNPSPWHPLIDNIRTMLNDFVVTTFDTCFLNRYDSHKDQLGWHADDSPEMDDERHIAIVSFGEPREIWFKRQGDSNDPKNVTKLVLESGSLCLMDPLMQRNWYHRIPKHHKQSCDTRISLTYRGYVQ